MRKTRIEDFDPPKAILSKDEKRILRKAKLWAKKFFIKAEKEGRVVMGGHGFDHTQRVAGMAATLSVMEGYRPFLPVLTSLLFDVGRTGKDPRSHNYLHGKLSAEFANKFLEGLPLFSRKDKTLVKNAMEDHPLLNKDVKRSFVVEIVMDADRLDSLGALGPVRAAATRWKLPLYSDQVNKSEIEKEIKSIHQDFAYRLTKWYDSLWTSSAKKIAEPRIKFLKDFIKEYEKEASFMLKAFKNLKI